MMHNAYTASQRPFAGPSKLGIFMLIGRSSRSPRPFKYWKPGRGTNQHWLPRSRYIYCVVSSFKTVWQVLATSFLKVIEYSWKTCVNTAFIAIQGHPLSALSTVPVVFDGTYRYIVNQVWTLLLAIYCCNTAKLTTFLLSSVVGWECSMMVFHVMWFRSRTWKQKEINMYIVYPHNTLSCNMRLFLLFSLYHCVLSAYCYCG